ncbi:hypothetical protein [Rhizomicrobium electricum]|uniref:hypothetical protein n=1 Tax=Rhizomicrobium electricum TaxID=480070 RepID=UPI00141F9E53|nr:hypothetical protein [Rhizomicrobium electricum]NIJ47934.1 heme-degrading monooxygenase HmoA [Rhizomicrobium electricum]
MRRLLKGAAIALVLAGATFATTGTSNAEGFAITTSDHGRDHRNTSVSVDFGNVAYGYRDGYWDNSHRWHNWRNSREHRDYRDHHRDSYRSGYHDRYSGQGWMGDDRSVTSVSFDFGDVAYGYRDGYWDNSHRWHNWRNRNDHDNYRNHQGNHYRNGNHDRYRGHGWQRN